MVAQGDRRGYQHLLDEFWSDAEDQGIPLPTPKPVSDAAFCKARKGLKPELLRELLESFRFSQTQKHLLKNLLRKWETLHSEIELPTALRSSSSNAKTLLQNIQRELERHSTEKYKTETEN